MVATQDLKLRWFKSLLPLSVTCQCGEKVVADYQLDPGRFLHLIAFCVKCDRFAFEDIVSSKMIPFEDTRYDYTIRKSAARPALIAGPGLLCEKCQADAVGTFNVIKELEVKTDDSRYPDYIFEQVSGPHHRCEKHTMAVDENVIPLKARRKKKRTRLC